MLETKHYYVNIANNFDGTVLVPITSASTFRDPLDTNLSNHETDGYYYNEADMWLPPTTFYDNSGNITSVYGESRDKPMNWYQFLGHLENHAFLNARDKDEGTSSVYHLQGNRLVQTGYDILYDAIGKISWGLGLSETNLEALKVLGKADYGVDISITNWCDDDFGNRDSNNSTQYRPYKIEIYNDGGPIIFYGYMRATGNKPNQTIDENTNKYYFSNGMIQTFTLTTSASPMANSDITFETRWFVGNTLANYKSGINEDTMMFDDTNGYSNTIFAYEDMYINSCGNINMIGGSHVSIGSTVRAAGKINYSINKANNVDLYGYCSPISLMNGIGFIDTIVVGMDDLLVDVNNKISKTNIYYNFLGAVVCQLSFQSLGKFVSASFGKFDLSYGWKRTESIKIGDGVTPGNLLSWSIVSFSDTYYLQYQLTTSYFYDLPINNNYVDYIVHGCLCYGLFIDSDVHLYVRWVRWVKRDGPGFLLFTAFYTENRLPIIVSDKTNQQITVGNQVIFSFKTNIDSNQLHFNWSINNGSTSSTDKTSVGQLYYTVADMGNLDVTCDIFSKNYRYDVSVSMYPTLRVIGSDISFTFDVYPRPVLTYLGNPVSPVTSMTVDSTYYIIAQNTTSGTSQDIIDSLTAIYGNNVGFVPVTNEDATRVTVDAGDFAHYAGLVVIPITYTQVVGKTNILAIAKSKDGSTVSHIKTKTVVAGNTNYYVDISEEYEANDTFVYNSRLYDDFETGTLTYPYYNPNFISYHSFVTVGTDTCVKVSQEADVENFRGDFSLKFNMKRSNVTDKPYMKVYYDTYNYMTVLWNYLDNQIEVTGSYSDDNDEESNITEFSYYSKYNTVGYVKDPRCSNSIRSIEFNISGTSPYGISVDYTIDGMTYNAVEFIPVRVKAADARTPVVIYVGGTSGISGFGYFDFQAEASFIDKGTTVTYPFNYSDLINRLNYAGRTTDTYLCRGYRLADDYNKRVYTNKQMTIDSWDSVTYGPWVLAFDYQTNGTVDFSNVTLKNGIMYNTNSNYSLNMIVNEMRDMYVVYNGIGKNTIYTYSTTVSKKGDTRLKTGQVLGSTIIRI